MTFFLSGNKWSLEEAYREIQDLCIAEAKSKNRNASSHNENMQYAAKPPHHKHIDFGRGTAVNLDKKAAPTGLVASVPSNHHGLELPSNVLPTYQQAVAVGMPSNKNERIIPIQIQGRNDSHHNPGGNFQNSNSPNNENHTSPTFALGPTGDIDRVVYPSKPSTVAPGTESDPHPESDDVFDENCFKKPSTNYCKLCFFNYICF